MNHGRRLASKLWVLLDSESVKLFVWPYYISLLAWGVYGTFFSEPIDIIQPDMGHAAYDAWVWMHIVGTLAVMLGLVIPDKKAGLVMQLGGNICMGCVLFAYELSSVTNSYWGRGTYSVFIVAPYVIGCLFLSATCVRKLHLANRGAR